MITQLKMWCMMAIFIYCGLTIGHAVGVNVAIEFISFGTIGLLIYEERCANCGFLVWRRNPGSLIEFNLGPFWISPVCKRCGHKHR